MASSQIDINPPSRIDSRPVLNWETISLNSHSPSFSNRAIESGNQDRVVQNANTIHPNVKTSLALKSLHYTAEMHGNLRYDLCDPIFPGTLFLMSPGGFN
jgi:hypothetical protein